jgi:hypothetical protein
MSTSISEVRFSSFAAVNGTSGRTMGRNQCLCLYQTNIAETCQFKCHQTQYFADFSINYDFLRWPGPLIWSCASIFKRPKAVFHDHKHRQRLFIATAPDQRLLGASITMFKALYPGSYVAQMSWSSIYALMGPSPFVLDPDHVDIRIFSDLSTLVTMPKISSIRSTVRRSATNEAIRFGRDETRISQNMLFHFEGIVPDKSDKLKICSEGNFRTSSSASI